MNALQLLNSLKASQIKLYVEDGKLCYDAIAGVMTNERLQLIREHKEQLLSLLQTSGETGVFQFSSFPNTLGNWKTGKLDCASKEGQQLLSPVLPIVEAAHVAGQVKMYRIR